MSTTKDKGDRAELIVAADLVRLGYKVAIPFGDNWPYDLILSRDTTLERVQVKYTASDGRTLKVKCVSYSITAGRQVGVQKYTAATIDWLAVYDNTTDACYYLPAALLGAGKNTLWFDLTGERSRSRQALEYRWKVAREAE